MILPERFRLLRRLISVLGEIPWLRILVILALFGMVIVFSKVMSESSSTMGLLAAVGIIGIVGVFVLQADLSYGPVVILLVAAFVPFAMPTGTGSVVPASMLVSGLYVGLWVIKSLAFEKRLAPHFFQSAGWLWAFIVVACISLVWSNVLRDTVVRAGDSFPFVQLASLGVMVLLPLSMLLTATIVRSEKILSLMVFVFLAAGAAELARLFLGLPIRVNGQGLFSMWVIALSGSLIVVHRGLSLAVKAVLVGMIGLFILHGFFRNISWIAGWLPGLLALGIIALLRSKELILVGLLSLPVVIYKKYGFFLDAIDSETQVSGYTRLAAWAQNWTVTRLHWLFGTGPAGYSIYYMTYFPTHGMATHSNYLDILSQTGVLGMITYLAFFIALGVYGYRVWRSVKGQGNLLEAVALAALSGLVGSIVIMGFGDWLIPFAYTQTISGFNHSVYTWIFLGTIPVVDVLARRSAAQSL